MSASIRFDHLFTYAVEEPQVRLPISFLSDGSGHIHGELAIHIGGGNPLPSLGYFGPDDACLNTWTQELHAIEEALSKAEDADYVFDEGEQGQPAYQFRREGEVLYVSVIDSLLSGARGDPSYQDASCLWSEFLVSIHQYMNDLKVALENEAPRVAGDWWSINSNSAA